MSEDPETIRLRDHTRLCEHGSLWPHWDNRGRWWKQPDCFGGFEVVLRRVGDHLWEEVRESDGR